MAAEREKQASRRRSITPLSDEHHAAASRRVLLFRHDDEDARAAIIRLRAYWRLKYCPVIAQRYRRSGGGQM